MSGQNCLENQRFYDKRNANIKIEKKKKNSVFYNINWQNEQDKSNKSHEVEIKKLKNPINNT